jgi:hypothetical protein
MSFKELCILLSKLESKKRQIDIAQIREVMSLLSDLVYQDMDIAIWTALHRNGRLRAKKKK